MAPATTIDRLVMINGIVGSRADDGLREVELTADLRQPKNGETRHPALYTIFHEQSPAVSKSPVTSVAPLFGEGTACGIFLRSEEAHHDIRERYIDRAPSSSSSTSSLQERDIDASQVFGIDRLDRRGEIGGEINGEAFMVSSLRE